MHQALGVYYIGWDSGIQYWLIYLIGLSFFNAQWKNKVRIFFFSIVFYLPIFLLSQKQYAFRLIIKQEVNGNMT